MIIKSEKDLANPFMCFALFMKWMKEVEEDYLDYFCKIVQPYPFVVWLQCKEYIENKDADHFFDISGLDIPGILQDNYLFPYTCGSSGLAHYKVYALLAEYVSQFRLTRERVYKSVFEEVYYTDENGVNLCCIIDDEQLECRTDVLDVKVDDEYGLQELTYKELYTLATSKTIKECDYFI